ncbi:MAG: hypothetical protein MUF01_03105 [Bryobacterales bacterium]|jgi:hypothetical protein|nr:hypothetical protein [Bryobacterales bacterium]
MIEAVSSGTSRKRKSSKPRASAKRAKLPANSSDAAGLVPQQAIPGAPADDLAHQVRAVIRSFHSSVASPLASIGLQLELLRTDPSVGPDASAELRRITSGLDDIIDVVRASNRQLRRLEQQILSQEDGPLASTD